MEGSRRVDMNVADSSVRGTQEGMATVAAPPGKMQTGRVVQGEVVATGTSCQMAAALNTTSRRIISDYAVAVTSVPDTARKTADAEAPDRFQIAECKYEPTAEFRMEVENSLKTLEMAKREHGSESFLFCLAVAGKVEELTRKNNLLNTESENYKFMACQLGPYYDASLHSALEVFQHAVATEAGWEYHVDFISVAKCIIFPSNSPSDRRADKKLMKELYKQILRNELNYLRHIKDSCLMTRFDTCDCVVIEQLISSGLCMSPYHFMSGNDAEKIEREKQQLMDGIRLKDSHICIKEAIERLEMWLQSETAGGRLKRQYGSLLKTRGSELENESKKVNSAQESTRILKEIYALYNKLRSSFEFRLLPEMLKASVMNVVSDIIQYSCDNLVPLEEEALEIMDDMKEKRLLSRECARDYLCWKEQKFLSQDQTGKITDAQCEELIADIWALIEGATEADYLKAASKLEPLWYKYRYEARDPKQGSALSKEINRIGDILYEVLFEELVRKFYECKKTSISDEVFEIEMHPYRSRFVRLQPYAFIITDKKDKECWKNTACSAWCCDLVALSFALSFKEEDVDFFLDLKCIAPDVPNMYTRKCLEEALTQLFSVMSDKTKKCADEIPVEKIAVLSQWVDNLDYMGNVSKDLKEFNEVWKRMHKETTASVTSDQPVSDDALVQPESERSLITENEPLFTSAARVSVEKAPVKKAPVEKAPVEKTPVEKASIAGASVAETLKDNITFSELQAKFKGEKSFAFFAAGFTWVAKQLASGTTSAAMVTAQAPQASLSSWPGDGQSLLRIDEPVSRSTVTVPPVEMMTANGNVAGCTVDMKVAGCIREIQEGMDAPREKIQTKKVVHETATIQTQTSCPTAASNTLQQTTSDDHTVAVQGALEATAWEMDNVEKSDGSETEEYQDQSTAMFQAAVTTSISILTSSFMNHGLHSLPFCLRVAKTAAFLIGKYQLHDIEDEKYKFMLHNLGLYYTVSLPAALTTMQQKAANQWSWECHTDLVTVAKCFCLHFDDSDNKTANKLLLDDLFQKFIRNELDYLNYIKDLPSGEHIIMPADIIDKLLSVETLVVHYDFISEETRADFMKEKAQVMDIIKQKSTQGGVGKDWDELEEAMRHGTINMLEKRRYHDVLLDKIEKMSSKVKRRNMDEKIQEFIAVVEEARHWYDICCADSVGFNLLCSKIKALISGSIKIILKQSICYCVPLEQKIFDSIDELMVMNMLGEECKRIYLRYKGLQESVQTVMGGAIQTNKITDTQCQQCIDEIFLYLDNSPLIAANMLKKLWSEHRYEIRVLANGESYMRRIVEIKNKLRAKLFVNIFDLLKEYEKFDNEEYNRKMSRHRADLVKLSPYLFVLTLEADIQLWEKVVCAVWYSDLVKLSRRMSFKESDIDCLLALKRMAPDVPDPRIHVVLDSVLIRIMSIVNQYGTGKIPVEKIMTLSQWIHDLIHIFGYAKSKKKLNNEWLIEVNKVWREANGGATASITSDQPVPDSALIQPESEKLQPSGRKLLSVLAETDSEAKVLKTGVVFPWKRDSSGVDKNYFLFAGDDGDNNGEEQLAPAATSAEMLTVWAPQAASSWRAGQRPAKDGQVSWAAVVAKSVGKVAVSGEMTTSQKVDVKTASRSRESREGMITPPGQTRTERGAVPEAAAIQTFRPMMPTSNTSQQTKQTKQIKQIKQTISGDCAVVVQGASEISKETINIEKS